jgi:hypothetical protein
MNEGESPGESVPAWDLQFRNYLGFVSLAAGMLTFALVWPIGHSAKEWILVPLGAIAVGARLGFRGWRQREYLPSHATDHTAIAQTLPRSPLSLASQLASGALFLNPSRYVLRIVHEVEPRGEYFLNRLSREIRMPSWSPPDSVAAHDPESSAAATLEGATPPQVESGLGPPSPVPVPQYLPLIYLDRGSSVDDLSVTCSEARISIVPSSVAADITFDLLAYLALTSFGDAAESVLEQMRPAILADANVRSTRAALAPARRSIRTLRNLQLQAGGNLLEAEKARDELIGLLESALTTYIVYGEVAAAPGAELSVHVRYNSGLEEELMPGKAPRNRFARFKARLQVAVGVLPHVFRIPLVYERATASYHLRFLLPTDLYVVLADVSRRVSPSDEPVEEGHIVVAQANRTNTYHYAHVNVRPIRGANPAGKLLLRIAVRERPPGLLGIAALVGLLQLATQLFVLALYSKLFKQQGGQLSGGQLDVPTLLLAAPAVVSAWVANQVSPERVAHMPLTAVVGVAFNAASALCATFLAILASEGVDPWSFTVGGLEIDHPLWLGLVGAGTIAIGIVIRRCAQASYLFADRLRRPPDLERYAV